MTFQKWPQARICIHSRFHCEGQKIKPLTSRMKDGCATCSNTIATYTSHCTLQQYLHITHNMMSLKVLVGSSQPMWFHIYDILYKISNALKVHLLSATSDICAVCETDLVKTKWSSLLTYTCMVLCCIQSRGILNTTLWTLFWFYWKWLWCSLNLLLMALVGKAWFVTTVRTGLQSDTRPHQTHHQLHLFNKWTSSGTCALLLVF